MLEKQCYFCKKSARNQKIILVEENLVITSDETVVETRNPILKLS